jgi:hypothetical protein
LICGFEAQQQIPILGGRHARVDGVRERECGIVALGHGQPRGQQVHQRSELRVQQRDAVLAIVSLQQHRVGARGEVRIDQSMERQYDRLTDRNGTIARTTVQRHARYGQSQRGHWVAIRDDHVGLR